jgi:hypothetical protein
MDNQILINIKDSSKLAFFLEVIKNFDFVSVKEVITDDNIKGDEDLLDGIKQAVKEINLVKKGKLKTRSAKDLLDEL